MCQFNAVEGSTTDWHLQHLGFASRHTSALAPNYGRAAELQATRSLSDDPAGYIRSASVMPAPSGLALIDDSSRLADMRVWLDEKGH
jgi:hypothetical protein